MHVPSVLLTNAIQHIKPHILYALRAPAFPVHVLQGNGFITDKDLISKYGLSDANVFFSVLWDKPYVDKVCFIQAIYSFSSPSVAARFHLHVSPAWPNQA
jgi:hypothetical protein